MGAVRRRQFLIASGGLLAARLAGAQQTAKTRILGALGVGPRPTPEQLVQSPVLARLRQLGWIEGQNLAVARFYAEGRADRLPELAAELVNQRPDVIWTQNPDAAIAAARATKTIPIVFWSVGYPIEQGLIDSFAHPGRNVTGVAFFTGAEVLTKQLEFLRELAPSIKRVAWFTSASTLRTVAGGEYRRSLSVLESAAQSLGIELQRHWVDKREDFDAAFNAIVDSRAQAFGAPINEVTWQHRQLILEFAIRNRLPSVYAFSGFAEAGGLVSYGPDQLAMMIQSVSYIDKILRGAKPADLPVEMPSRYDLVVNLKTAKALGLKVPQSILVRADRAIE